MLRHDCAASEHMAFPHVMVWLDFCGSWSCQSKLPDVRHGVRSFAGVNGRGSACRAPEVEELLRQAAPSLTQTPVAEPWSWWPSVQAAWQRGEHEQVTRLSHALPELAFDQRS